MPDAIWIDRDEELPALALRLSRLDAIGVDTEFLRERTFFPKLCLLQIAAGGDVWCIDALRGDFGALVPVLTSTATRKVIHAARQDLEAFCLASKRVMTPIFDTQIAAACVGMKPQIGYAELAQSLLGVTVTKDQTRTDWSRRPLRPEQLAYAADDVVHLVEIADRLTARLSELGRAHWVLEDCAAIADPRLYQPDPERAWQRLRGIEQLDPAPRARAKALAVWRERLARDHDLPRSWVLSDAAIFEVAHANPASSAALAATRGIPASFNAGFAASLLDALREQSRGAPADLSPSRESRPTAEQKALIDRLSKVVDARAAELGVSSEVLAPRGELKSLAFGKRDAAALTGWRRHEIGEALLANIP